MTSKFITALFTTIASLSLANATVEPQEIRPKAPQSALYTRQDLEKISNLASLVGLLSVPYGLTQHATEEHPDYSTGSLIAGLAGTLTNFQVTSMLDTALEEDRLLNNTTELLQRLVVESYNAYNKKVDSNFFDTNTYNEKRETLKHVIQTLTCILTKKATMHATKKILPGEAKRINRRIFRAITNALCHTLIYSYDIIAEKDLSSRRKAKGILTSSIISLLQELTKEACGEIIIRNATDASRCCSK